MFPCVVPWRITSRNTHSPGLQSGQEITCGALWLCQLSSCSPMPISVIVFDWSGKRRLFPLLIQRTRSWNLIRPKYGSILATCTRWKKLHSCIVAWLILLSVTERSVWCLQPFAHKHLIDPLDRLGWLGFHSVYFFYFYFFKISLAARTAISLSVCVSWENCRSVCSTSSYHTLLGPYCFRHSFLLFH